MTLLLPEVRKDGSVVAWGDPQRGGDLSSVLVKLKQGATVGGRGM